MKATSGFALTAALLLPPFLIMMLCGRASADNEVHIGSAGELIKLSNNVSFGTNYLGTTVFLDNDIDFSDGNGSSLQFTPICPAFQGTFNGQGYAVKNLKVNSSSLYAGLFGHSEGVTIRNVVMDSSTSFTNFYSSSTGGIFLGGYIGKCSGNKGPCVIENCVNLAEVSFKGRISGGSVSIGGMAGYLTALYTHEGLVKNCANYGEVSCSRESNPSANVGGIAGGIIYSGGDTIKIQNCANYGTLTYSGNPSDVMNIGGIAGIASCTDIENCVNFGTLPLSDSSKTFVGSIVGGYEIGSNKGFQITNCYWSDEGNHRAWGSGHASLTVISESFSFNSSTLELKESVSVGSYTGTSLFDALNAAADFYTLRDYSHWLLNKDRKFVSFKANGRSTGLTLSQRLILLPSLASEGKLWFDGWYNDSSCKTPLTDFEITSDTALYGKYEKNNNNHYTITLDTGGKKQTETITGQYSSVVELPRNVTEGCDVAWWETDYGEKVPFNFTVSAHNVTLHAVLFCTHITSAEDLVDFARFVNIAGTNHKGATVFLDNDIDFTDELSKKFEPINNFQGTFDGQGHTIRNLKVNVSSSVHTGLFSYSNGIVIKGVVMDTSCSIVSSCTDTGYAYIGGLIGRCFSMNEDCVAENVVSMGSVLFNGNTTGELYIGGIAGLMASSSSSYKVTVKNCANYGAVTHSGASGDFCMGGIAGLLSSSIGSFVQNSANYGTIICSGVATALSDSSIGGIVGKAGNIVYLENCLSGGNIKTISADAVNLGSIVGWSTEKLSITHSIQTKDVGVNDACGGGSSITITVIGELNSTTMQVMNKYVEMNNTSNTWSKWTALHMRGGKVSNLSQPALVVPLKPFPVPEKEGDAFLFWCVDDVCSAVYDPKSSSSSSTAETTREVYAFWSNVLILFDFGNRTVAERKTVKYGEAYGALPTPRKTGHTFAGWFSEANGRGTKIEPNTNVTTLFEHTLYAQWTTDSGSSSLSSSFPSSAYPFPKLSSSSSMSPTNIVKIVLGTKDMTQEETKNLIKSYTDEDFTIERFEIGEEQTTVIIVFNNVEAAKNFVGAIETPSNTLLTSISFLSEVLCSFSPKLQPLLVLALAASFLLAL